MTNLTQENEATAPEKGRNPDYKASNGAVKTSIFVNEYEGKDGKSFKAFDVNFTKSYTPDNGITWKHSKSFDKNNLDNLIIAAKGAKEWIALQEES